jgi:hypothetical protein
VTESAATLDVAELRPEGTASLEPISPELVLVDSFLALREHYEPSRLNGAGFDGDAPPGPISPELVLVDPVLAARARELLAGEEATDCLAPRPRPVPADTRGVQAAAPLKAEALPTPQRAVPWRVLAGAAALVVVAGVFSVPGWVLPFRGGARPGVTLEQLTRPVPAAAPRRTPAAPPALPSSVHGTARVRLPGQTPKQQHRPVSHAAAPTATTPSRSTPAPAQRAKPAAANSAKQHTTTKTAPSSPALPPLGWAPVASAVGYDVELVRGARRVFATTTSRTQLALPRAWSYGGRRYRLVAGQYRWYVWPLFRRADRQTARRGRPIVAAKLTVPR